MSHGIIRIAQPTCVFRRELFERLGGFREEMHCVFDTELWMRFAQAGATFGITPAYNAAFRIHPRAKGSSWRERYREEARMLDRIHPKMRWRGLMHYLVRYGYKALQYLTLREFIARRDAQRWRGRTVAEVFGNGDDLLRTQAGEPIKASAVLV